nr:unnamed protein product [Digitaria exilis]
MWPASFSNLADGSTNDIWRSRGGTAEEARVAMMIDEALARPQRNQQEGERQGTIRKEKQSEVTMREKGKEP